MQPSQITQDSLIQALVMLRQAHPQLPKVAWEISAYPTVEALMGYSHGPDSVDVLLAYAEALGGDIVPKHTFDNGGVRMQSLMLSTQFADVRVEIRGAVAAPNLSHLALVAVAA